MQAQSIVEGSITDFVRLNQFAVHGSQGRYPLGPVAYPWGTPLLLAPIYAAFGLDPLALKTLNILCWILFLLVLGFAFPGRVSGRFTALLVGLFAFNPTLLAALDRIHSDVPFLLFSTATLVFIDRLYVEERGLFQPFVDRFLIGALCAAAFLIRSNGGLLLLTIAALQIFTIIKPNPTSSRDTGGPSRWGEVPSRVARAVLALTPYAAFTTVALIAGAVFPAGGSYLLTELSRRLSVSLVLHNLLYYGGLGATFFAGLPWPGALYVLFVFLAVYHLVREAIRERAYVVYCVLTLVLFVNLSTPPEGLRYLFPILPFAVYFAVAGLAALKRRLSATVGRYAAPVLGWAVCGGFLVLSVGQGLGGHREAGDGPFAGPAMELWGFINEELPGDAEIVFFKPRVLELMTGRRALALTDPRAVLRHSHVGFYREKQGAQISAASLDRLIGQGHLREIFSNPDFRLFQVRAPDS